MYRFAVLMFSHDDVRVHPDDLAKFESCHGPANAHYFVNFEDLGRVGDYQLLLVEGETYRIGLRVVREFAPTKFQLGQKVKTLNGTNREGWVRKIMWHFKSQSHNYYLEIEGCNATRKKVSRRYLENHLEAIDS